MWVNTGNGIRCFFSHVFVCLLEELKSRKTWLKNHGAGPTKCQFFKSLQGKIVPSGHLYNLAGDFCDESTGISFRERLGDFLTSYVLFTSSHVALMNGHILDPQTMTSNIPVPLGRVPFQVSTIIFSA